MLPVHSHFNYFCRLQQPELVTGPLANLSFLHARVQRIPNYFRGPSVSEGLAHGQLKCVNIIRECQHKKMYGQLQFNETLSRLLSLHMTWGHYGRCGYTARLWHLPGRHALSAKTKYGPTIYLSVTKTCYCRTHRAVRPASVP